MLVFQGGACGAGGNSSLEQEELEMGRRDTRKASRGQVCGHQVGDRQAPGKAPQSLESRAGAIGSKMG